MNVDATFSSKNCYLQDVDRPEEKSKVDFDSFKEMVLTTFKVSDCSELPFQKLEYAFDIFNSSEDFSFDDKDERLSNFMVLMASLYAHKKNEKICYISPTYYYAQQAAMMRTRYLRALSGSSDNGNGFSCVVPGMYEFEGEVNKCKVLFMHGKDFSEYLPKDWKGRKIIQIFPNEDVPVDPIKRSYCSMHDCDN